MKKVHFLVFIFLCLGVFAASEKNDFFNSQLGYAENIQPEVNQCFEETSFDREHFNCKEFFHFLDKKSSSGEITSSDYNSQIDKNGQKSQRHLFQASLIIGNSTSTRTLLVVSFLMNIFLAIIIIKKDLRRDERESELNKRK